MNKKVTGNLLYGQSGGPTSVINASAYGLFKEAFKNKQIIPNVYAMHFGLEGLLEEDLIKIEDNKNLSKLLNTPGAFFGSNRFKINYEKDPKTFASILAIFKKYNIRYFFYNGGNDSMDAIYQISHYLKIMEYECYCIGIPKTIDNDLVLIDHTPGYASAAKFIANIVTEIYYDDHSYKKGRVNIIEIMGRNAGWLTASSILASLKGAKPDLIYVPECDFDVNDFLSRVKKIYGKNKHCLVCISEGIHGSDNQPLIEANKVYDAFNHLQLGGVSRYLSELINLEFGYKTRAIELSLLQRANSIIPSEEDIKEAINCGKYALRASLKHQNNKMVTMTRKDQEIYAIKYSLVNIEDVKNKVKYLPEKYINCKDATINTNFIDYVYPLIKSKQKSHLLDGLLDTFNLEK